MVSKNRHSLRPILKKEDNAFFLRKLYATPLKAEGALITSVPSDQKLVALPITRFVERWSNGQLA